MSRRVITKRFLDKQNEIMLRTESPSNENSSNPNEQINQTPDNYLTSLIKYIPSEIVAAYVCILGILYPQSSNANIPNCVGWVIFGMMVVITGAYIAKSTYNKLQPPAYMQIIVSMFSFIIWAYTLGGPFKTTPHYDSRYGAITTILFTVLVPFFSGSDNGGSTSKKANE